MHHLKSVLLAGVACAIAAPGFAADLSRPVPYTKAPIAAPIAAYNWTGFYLGGNAGAKWADFDSTLTGPASSLGFSGSSDISWLAGGQVGYMWQTGQFVFGVEGDIDATHLHNTFTAPLGVPAPFGTGDTLSVKNDWQASARGRLGYAWDRTLIYVTGGGAWANLKAVGTATNGTSVSDDRTVFGWTVGGGIDYGIAPGWSIGAEYRFTRFDNNDNNGFGTLRGVPVTLTSKLDTNEVTGRVNYHFNWAGPAQY